MGQEDGGDLQMGKVGGLFGFYIISFGQSVQNVLIFFVFNGAVGEPGRIADDNVKFPGKEIGLVEVLNDEFPDAVPSSFFDLLQPEIYFVKTVCLQAVDAP